MGWCGFAGCGFRVEQECYPVSFEVGWVVYKLRGFRLNRADWRQQTKFGFCSVEDGFPKCDRETDYCVVDSIRTLKSRRSQVYKS